ncbi:hypothetical protein BH18GEM1_BH18GEM1_03500 [soil metagenome]
MVVPLTIALIAATRFASPAPLASQVVDGTVVEEGTRDIVTGGFVVLIGPAGEQVDGALTDGKGSFHLEAPGPGSYSLGLDRIGYMSVTTQPFPLAAGQTIEYRLTALVKPIDLSAIIVRVDSECHVRPGEDLAVARVWEEARKALIATAWTQGQGLLSYTVVGRERTLDPRTLRVRKERSHTRQGVSRGSPYVALSSDRLAREGYARLDDDAHTYYAPDAATLLSDSFLDRHCFRLRASRETGPGLIGLAFEPVGADERVDIQGMIWLDEVTAELSHIEFEYTGLPGAMAEAAGGTVEFERLPTGQWIVRRWRIRMPVVRQASEDPYSHLTMDPSRRRSAVIAIEEDSGEVERVVVGGEAEGPPRAAAAVERPVEPISLAAIGKDPDAWLAGPGGSCPARGTEGAAVVRGVVRDSATDVALPGARVTLTWGGPGSGSAVGSTDGSGHYVLCGVPSGEPVTAVAHFPRRRAQVALTLAGSARSADLDFDVAGTEPVEGARIESELAVTRGPAGLGGGLSMGRVRDAVTGEPLAGAQIILPEIGRGTVSEDDGGFRLASIPPGRHRLRVELLGYESAETRVDAGSSPVVIAARLVPSPIALAALEVRISSPETDADRARGEGRYVLTSGEIPQNSTLSIGELLARRLPGLRHGVRGGCPVLRTRDGPVGIVVLDNQRFSDTCVLNLVRPEDVERIELLPGLAAAIEYGRSAGGGVLLVTTKRGG